MTIDEAPKSLQAVRTIRVARQRGAEIALHSHAEAQLIHALSGTLQVHTTVGKWLVPSAFAVWIPGFIAHRIELLSDAELWLAYWKPDAANGSALVPPLNQAFALHVTPLIKELFKVAVPENVHSARATLALQLILQELMVAEDAPTYLPLPTSKAGRRIAERILAVPAAPLSLDDLAFDAATSRRNVSRLFPKETGLTFKSWRQRARIAVAIERLSSGETINRVARQTGFATSAAFAAAFRQVTTTTPSEFQRILNCNVDSMKRGGGRRQPIGE